MKTKNNILLFSLLIGFLSCKTEKIYPSGTEKIDDHLYIDEFLITNVDYLQFLYCIENFWHNESSDFLRELPRYGISMDGDTTEALYLNEINLNFSKHTENEVAIYGMISNPDSALYAQMLPPLDSLIIDNLSLETYLHHIAYRNYPALYITKEQAEMFCKWRSDIVNLRIGLSSKDSLQYSKYAAPVKYRLPTKNEWIQSFETSLNNKHKPKHYRFETVEPMDGYYDLYNKKFEFQFYTQLGKLSEIVSEGEIIGYNYLDSTRTKDSLVLRPYIFPSPGIGFRCVCEVTESIK